MDGSMLDVLYPDGEDGGWKVVVSTFVFTAVFTTFSIALSWYILPIRLKGMHMGGGVAVLLSIMAILYPLTRYIRSRDKMELEKKWSEPTLIQRHLEEIEVYFSCFLAATMVFSAAYFVLPTEFFQLQTEVLGNIEAMRTTGAITADYVLSEILANNLGVFVLTFVLGFVISGGFLFILLWNASVLGVRLGQLSSSIAESPLQLMRYLPHGIPEIASYILAGLAGALLSYYVEHRYVRKSAPASALVTVLKDAAWMLVTGVAILILAGYVEVYFALIDFLLVLALLLGMGTIVLRIRRLRENG